MLRCIREIKPRWIVGENVLGLVNWNGGMVFEEVQADLEAEGYEVQPYVLPAAAVNAPHRRDRVWFVAYRNKCSAGSSRKSGGTKSNGSKNNDEQKLWGEQAELNTRSHELLQDASNTNCERYSGSTSNGIQKMEGFATQQYSISSRCSERTDWLNFPTVSPICDGDDGLSDRLDSITFPKWRKESIKAGGNAIVPQVVYQIFKAIEQYEHQRPSNTTNR